MMSHKLPKKTEHEQAEVKVINVSIYWNDVLKNHLKSCVYKEPSWT